MAFNQENEHHCNKLVLENGLRMAKYPSPCHGEQCHCGDGLSGIVRHTRTMPFTSSRSLQLDDSIDCRTSSFCHFFCLCLRHGLNFRTCRVTSGPLFHVCIVCLFDISWLPKAIRILWSLKSSSTSTWRAVTWLGEVKRRSDVYLGYPRMMEGFLGTSQRV